jgi:hypothetical protein
LEGVLIRFYVLLFLMTMVFFGLRTLFTKVIPRYIAQWHSFLAALQREAENYAQQQSNFSVHGGMSVEEAYQVLGLKAGASESGITEAHRKLIQKNHPDRGGSDYLAAKINLAKKTLLNK